MILARKRRSVCSVLARSLWRPPRLEWEWELESELDLDLGRLSGSPISLTREMNSFQRASKMVSNEPVG